MSGVCAEEQNKFYPSHQLLSPKKTLREIDIPPRKLLTSRAAACVVGTDVYSEETMLQKFLPSNDSDEGDPYSSDHFRMFEFKVRRCTRSRSHDWTDCPFAHPGEKARRRDPRRYHYSGTVCPEYRRGGCSRGDACEHAHGVFESWLHPSRYRTEACKDGRNCKRKVCFFAHTPRQLRILPVTSSPSSNDMPCKKNLKQLLNHASKTNNNNCCLFCHCGASSSASPTSTLFGMSHFSPPLSPSSSSSPPPSPLKPRNVVSPISRYSDVNMNPHHVVSYKDMFTELVNSLERLNFNEGSPVSGAKEPNFPWLDVSLNCEEQQQHQRNPFIVPSFGCEDQQQQNQFIFSPSSIQTPTNGEFCSNRFMGNDNNKVVGGADVNGPDLAWVNELLM